MRFNTDDYTSPEKIDQTRVKSFGDIESHASFLTNMRINQMMQIADEVGFAAGENPDFRLITSYHSILNRIYLAVFSILQEEQQEEIQKLFSSFLKRFGEVLKDESRYTASEQYYLLMLLDNVQARINAFLQEKRYFFRYSSDKYTKLVGALQYYEDRRKELGLPSAIPQNKT